MLNHRDRILAHIESGHPDLGMQACSNTRNQFLLFLPLVSVVCYSCSSEIQHPGETVIFQGGGPYLICGPHDTLAESGSISSGVAESLWDLAARKELTFNS